MNLTEWLVGLFPDGGYFVEAGAHDGVGDSCTLALEATGKWSGLLVEPSSWGRSIRRPKCSVDRRCLWKEDGEVEFVEVSGGAVELSGISSQFYDSWDREGRPHTRRKVGAVTLTNALAFHRAPPVVEFLCLDTEGSELEILRAHDFSRYTFRTIVVEHNGVADRLAALMDLLAARYETFHNDGVNLWLLHR